MKHYIFILGLFISAAFFSGCKGTVVPPNPIQEIKKGLSPNEVFTITLADMDLDGNQYKHKYKIFKLVNQSTIEIETTPWKNVTDEFFLLHEDNLGMELLSRDKKGQINGLITPPGFTNLIGNEQLGTWTNSLELDSLDTLSTVTNSFWKFSPQHEIIASELGIKDLTIYQLEHELFLQQYFQNRPYYGEKLSLVGDTTKYGTRSRHWVHYYPIFYQRRSMKRNFYKSYSSTSSRSRGGGGFGK